MSVFPFEIPPNIYDLIGVIGFGLYVVSYMLLTTHRVTSGSIVYFAINLVAAGFVLFSLAGAFNLASALIQVFWIAVSIFAIALRWSPKVATGQATRQSG